jgi:UPF0755 protein
MSAAKTKSKKKTQPPQRKVKGLLLIAVSIIVLLMIVLWSSLFKSYPVEGKKQLLAINSGDTYSGFIDRLAKEDMASFPIILKLYQKIFIHDTLKAGVYEVREGMSIRQVLDMISISIILSSQLIPCCCIRANISARMTPCTPLHRMTP